jgi:hypothetical protein
VVIAPVGKRLGDCDHEDLKVLVLHYRAEADRNNTLADRYQALLQALYDREEDTVGSLPAELVEEVLGADQTDG